MIQKRQLSYRFRRNFDTAMDLQKNEKIQVLYATCHFQEFVFENEALKFKKIETNLWVSYSYTEETPQKIYATSTNCDNLSKGVLINICQKNQNFSSKNTEFRNFIFFIEPQFFAEYLPSFDKNDLANLNIENNLNLLPTLKVMLYDFSVDFNKTMFKDYYLKIWGENFMFQILNELVKKTELSNSVKKDDIDAIERLVTFCKNNIFKTTMSIEKMAEFVGMSTTKFKETFKTLYGVPPHQYLLDIKLEKAIKLLSLNECGVTEVAYKVGFNYPSSFSRLFKKKYNISPTDYLNQKNNKKEYNLGIA